MRALDRRDGALARSRVFGLLARLVLRGLDEELLATLREADWLLGPARSRGAVDLDELAAAHHQTFFLDVFPYAGAFLDPAAEAGAWADAVREHYQALGFTPRLDELAADHLGIELVFASFACGAIAEALEDEREALAQQIEGQLAAFYDGCLLSWLPALVVALPGRGKAGEGAGEGEGPGFWAQVLEETLELVAEHRQQLPGPRRGPTLASAPALLDDERTGLRQVAEYLVTPAAAGLFLGRWDIARLGRGSGLPRGFGSRALTLENLLRSAVDYGGLAALVDGLGALLGERERALRELDARLELGVAVAPWLEGLGHTRALLERLGRG